MIATQLPPIRILPPTELGDDPLHAMRPSTGPKPTPHFFLVGGHTSSRLTASRLPYTDPSRPPTPEQIAEALPGWKPCDCRRCRRVVVVWAWYGGDAVRLAHESNKSVARA